MDYDKVNDKFYGLGILMIIQGIMCIVEYHLQSTWLMVNYNKHIYMFC